MARKINTDDYSGPDRRNGDMKRIVWWIMGIIASVWVAGATGWAYEINEKVSRVLALEAKVTSIDHSLSNISRIMERLEDRVIYNERTIKRTQ